MRWPALLGVSSCFGKNSLVQGNLMTAFAQFTQDITRGGLRTAATAYQMTREINTSFTPALRKSKSFPQMTCGTGSASLVQNLGGSTVDGQDLYPCGPMIGPFEIVATPSAMRSLWRGPLVSWDGKPLKLYEAQVDELNICVELCRLLVLFNRTLLLFSCFPQRGLASLHP